MSQQRIDLLLKNLELTKKYIGSYKDENLDYKEQKAQDEMLLGSLDLAIFSLRSYVEPWTCIDCSRVTKLPYNDLKPQHCIHCHNNNMLPYAYMQVKSTDTQIKHLLSCVSHCANVDKNPTAIKALIEMPIITQQALQKSTN